MRGVLGMDDIVLAIYNVRRLPVTLWEGDGGDEIQWQLYMGVAADW